MNEIYELTPEQVEALLLVAGAARRFLNLVPDNGIPDNALANGWLYTLGQRLQEWDALWGPSGGPA